MNRYLKGKEEMRTIRFVENWGGKLDKKVFTTIRRSDEEKKEYYVGSLNEIFQVKLKGKDYCEATLCGIWYGKFEDITAEILTEDTGLPLDKSLILFSRFKCLGSNVIILTFQRL